MAPSLIDTIAEFFQSEEHIKNKKLKQRLDETKHNYVDNLQFNLTKILDNPKKIYTGLHKKPMEYLIQISDMNIAPLNKTDKQKADKSTTELIKLYENLPVRCANHIIDIVITDSKIDDENSIIIQLQDHRLKYTKQFKIGSHNEYKEAKKEICEYIQKGNGSWVYTLVQGTLF
jgi:hypothetical protein